MTKLHQNTQNPPKPQFFDIIDFTDLCYIDRKSQKPFLSTLKVSKIPKMYHMQCIKPPKINDKKLKSRHLLVMNIIVMEAKEKKEEEEKSY